MKPSISVIIPALNEEKNLDGVVGDTLSILNDRFSAYEIIIIDDGSQDQTPVLADRFSKENQNIKVVHHQRNMGLGCSVREGYQLSNMEYVVWNPGDRGMTRESLDTMLDSVGKADLIVPFIANPEFRWMWRRFVSRTYVLILNFLFGLKLRCYNGTVIYRTCLVKSVNTSTLGFFFFAETLITLLKTGSTYVEVPTFHQERSHGKSKAFTLKNICEILSKAVLLALDIRFNKKRKVSLPQPSGAKVIPDNTPGQN